MLNEKQKKQIRFMVSCNPTVENMARVAGLVFGDIYRTGDILKVVH